VFRFVIHEPYAHGNPYNIRKLNFLPAGTICPCNNNNNNNNNNRRKNITGKKQLLVRVLVLLLRYYLDRFYSVRFFFQPLNIPILHCSRTRPRIHHRHYNIALPSPADTLYGHTRSRIHYEFHIGLRSHTKNEKKKTKYTFIYNTYTAHRHTYTCGHSCPTISAKNVYGPHVFKSCTFDRRECFGPNTSTVRPTTSFHFLSNI